MVVTYSKELHLQIELITSEEGNLQQPGHLAVAGAMLDIICEDSKKCRKQWAWKALKTPEYKK